MILSDKTASAAVVTDEKKNIKACVDLVEKKFPRIMLLLIALIHFSISKFV